MDAYRAEQKAAICAPYHENQLALEAFANCRNHQVALFKDDDCVVICMKFDPYMAKLGGKNKDDFLRLSADMEIKLKFEYPAGSAGFSDIIAFSNDDTGLDGHDAYFTITSHHKEWFTGMVHEKGDTDVKYAKVSELEPHANRFQYESSLNALSTFMDDDFSDWHAIALNQLHDSIPIVDFAAGLPVSETVLVEAKQWLRSCMPWNERQLQAIEDMHRAKGRVQLICGVAGTGKTTLQAAQASLFVRLGGRSLCTATGNTNADRLAHEVSRFNKEEFDGKMRVHRLYASSKGVNIKKLGKAQKEFKKQGHSRDGRVSSMRDLMFKMLAKNGAEAIDLSIEKGVIDEAEKGELSYMKQVTDREGEVDVWKKLRRFLASIDKDEFKWENKDAMSDLNNTYDACKGHLVGLTDIIMTTNGNARCHELTEHWGRALELYGVARGKAVPAVPSIRALGVFIDEAAKEQEINIINTITTPALKRRKPDLFVFYGDEKQLPPTNTCKSRIRDNVQFNPYLERLDISFMGRLISQNFPRSYLVEQHRMHPSISKAPNEMFYDGMLVNAECVHRDLDVALPGLSKVLHGIIAKTFYRSSEQADYIGRARDDQARLHWLEMPMAYGANFDVNKRSYALLNHIRIFFKLVFPGLQKYFAENMNKKVMIIVAYKNALFHYKKAVRLHQEKSGFDDSHYPRLIGLDASQGEEADMVILDGSMQKADHMGKS